MSPPGRMSPGHLGSSHLPAAGSAGGPGAARKVPSGGGCVRLDQCRHGHDAGVQDHGGYFGISFAHRGAPGSLRSRCNCRRRRGCGRCRQARRRIRPGRRTAAAGATREGDVLPRPRRPPDPSRLQPQQQRRGWLPRRGARTHAAWPEDRRCDQRRWRADGLLAYRPSLLARHHDRLDRARGLQPLQSAGTGRSRPQRHRRADPRLRSDGWRRVRERRVCVRRVIEPDGSRRRAARGLRCRRRRHRPCGHRARHRFRRAGTVGRFDVSGGQQATGGRGLPGTRTRSPRCAMRRSRPGCASPKNCSSPA